MQFVEWLIFMNYLPIIITAVIIAGIVLGVIVKVYITRFGHKVLVFDENTIEVHKAKKTDDLIKFKGKTITKKYTARLMKSGLSTNRIYIVEDGSLLTTDFYPTIKEMQEEGKEPKDIEISLDDSSKQQIIESGVLDRFLAIFKNVGFSWQTFLFGLAVGIVICMIAVKLGVI